MGNPGQEHAGTRHNVGFLVADELARRSAAKFSFNTKWNSQVAECGGRTIMKPQTFMNLSGEAVADYARYFKLQREEITGLEPLAEKFAAFAGTGSRLILNPKICWTETYAQNTTQV